MRKNKLNKLKTDYLQMCLILELNAKRVEDLLEQVNNRDETIRQLYRMMETLKGVKDD